MRTSHGSPQVDRRALDWGSERRHRLTRTASSSNNAGVVARPFAAVVMSASLVAAALAAPMTHVHGDDDHASPHHSGRVIHTHITSHAGFAAPARGGPALDAVDDDRDARPIDLFHMVCGASLMAAGLPSALSILAAPDVSAGCAGQVVQHTHDPPFTRSLSSRAPPPSLS